MKKYLNNLGKIGYEAIFFVVAVGFVLLFFYPLTYSPIEIKGCIIGQPPERDETVTLAAIKNQFDPPRMGQPSDLSIGGPDPAEKAEYKLIRSHVPTMKESIPGPGDKWPAGWTFLGSNQKSPIEHTINIGEVPEKPGYDLYYPSEWGELDLLSGKRIYIRGEGILIFVNKDPSTVRQTDSYTIYDTEIYQDLRVLNNPDKGYQTEDIFFCKENQVLDKAHLTIPNQKVSEDKEQLQLQWVFLDQNHYWAVHCKPAVYLYPPKKMIVNVKVKPAGILTYTDPLYDLKKGWTVEAYPNGMLTNLSQNNFMKQYDYLYFESKVPDEIIEKPEQGWVIASKPENEDWFNPYEHHFAKILPELGLNEKQTTDFINYWKKALPYSPYYFVGIINPQNVDQIEQLEITPTPDRINRVRIFFERLDTPKKVVSPTILPNNNTNQSELFTVVEWGGMVKRDRNHPFTCSQ